MLTASGTHVPGATLVDPVVLARIGNLEIVARTVVEGVINGLHRSPHLGASMDFAEHRAYMPGDDIRRIDWKLFARSDRHYIKEFEAETNTNFNVLLDASRSMRYGEQADGSRLSKLAYARILAACLTYFSSTQRDRVGLVTFDDGIIDFVPPSARHLNVVLHTLDRLETSLHPASSSTSSPNAAPVYEPPRHAQVRARTQPLAQVFSRIGESIRRRSIVLVISDFYEEPQAVLEALTHLRGKGNDIMVFHVLDPRELDFSFTESANFVDIETGERMPIIPEYLRQQYKELISAHTGALSKLLGQNRIDYALFDTSKPIDQALFRYLSSRERLARVR